MLSPSTRLLAHPFGVDFNMGDSTISYAPAPRLRPAGSLAPALFRSLFSPTTATRGRLCAPESQRGPPLPTALCGSHLPPGQGPSSPWGPQDPAQPAPSCPCARRRLLSRSLTKCSHRPPAVHSCPCSAEGPAGRLEREVGIPAPAQGRARHAGGSQSGTELRTVPRPGSCHQ